MQSCTVRCVGPTLTKTMMRRMRSWISLFEIMCSDCTEDNTAALIQDGGLMAIISLLQGKVPELHGLSLVALMNLSQVGELSSRTIRACHS